MQIEEKRREIDEIDAEVVGLLSRRAAIAKEISMLKLSAGLPIVDVQREDEVLRRLAGRDAGEIGAAAMARIYRVVLEESRNFQARVRAEVLAHGVGK